MTTTDVPEERFVRKPIKKDDGDVIGYYNEKVPYAEAAKAHAASHMARATMFTFMRNHVERCIQLSERKNADYSGASDDPFFNLRRGGVVGFAVRLDDKVSRLLSLSKGQEAKVTDESMEDTVDDIINYGLLLRAFLEERKGL